MDGEYIRTEVGLIKERLKNEKTVKVSTCSDFHNGWSEDMFRAMPYVAEKLRCEGFDVREEINWGVTDYFIS